MLAPMCGRYVLSKPGDVLDEALESLKGFELAPSEQLQLESRFNVAPTQVMPIVVHQGLSQKPAATARGKAVMVSPARWNFRTASNAAHRSGRPLINARSETLQDKPSFASSFKARRCLVPADGFYEWRPSGNRQPFFFGPGNESAPRHGFCFAGLWQETLEKHRQPVEPSTDLEYCIVTGKAGPSMAEIHHRRPIIIEPRWYGKWLDPGTSAEELLDLLHASDPPLARHPVSFKVNSVRHDCPELIKQTSEAPVNLSLF